MMINDLQSPFSLTKTDMYTVSILCFSMSNSEWKEFLNKYTILKTNNNIFKEVLVTKDQYLKLLNEKKIIICKTVYENNNEPCTMEDITLSKMSSLYFFHQVITNIE